MPWGRTATWLALAGLFLLALGLLAYVQLDVGQRLDLLEWMKRNRAEWLAVYGARPMAVLGVLFVAYVVVSALPIPGAVALTPVAGAVLGLAGGTVIVSFASAVGATLAFVVARHLLRGPVQRRFGHRLARINEGVERDGAWYVMSLHLAPAMPTLLINLLAALTRMRARRYYWATQLGMLPGNIVWVNAGTQLGAIEHLSDVLSPTLLASLTLLALFPLLAKWLVAALGRARR